MTMEAPHSIFRYQRLPSRIDTTVMTHNQYVYIIDDDEAVRDAMGMLMETQQIEYILFANGDEFLDYYDGTQRGCLVLDIRMPRISGLELQKKIRTVNPDLPIIFITGHGDIPMAVEAMREGAVDFLRKPINERDLISRIRETMKTESGTWSRIESRQKMKMKLARLTEREREIFELVSDGQTNKVIAIDLNISERTVEVHRSNVMKKMGVRTLAELVRIRIAIESQ